MLAAQYKKYGPPTVFYLDQVPDPKLKKNQVLVEVKASSVNPVDWKIRRGNLKFVTGIRFPKRAGSDFAGIVIDSRASGYKKGDLVYGMQNPVKGGAYSQYLAVNQQKLTHMPRNLTFIQAAALPLAGLTALQVMENKGAIEAGDHVLVNACAGGVGHLAVQYCKARGANVTGICSTGKIPLAKKLGADQVIDYKKEDIYQHNQKYDIVFDPIGSLAFHKFKPFLQDKSTFIAFAPTAATIWAWFYTVFSRQKVKFFLTNSNAKDLQHLRTLVEDHKIRPLIHAIYPLNQLSEAQEESENGHAAGKIVVDTTP